MPQELRVNQRNEPSYVIVEIDWIVDIHIWIGMYRIYNSKVQWQW